MVTTLPRPIQLKLEQTLTQWQHWQLPSPLPERPTVVTLLGDGLSNYSVRVASGDLHFVVRIDGIVPSQHGLNRQIEWRALTNAAASRLAPTPRYFNPDLGTLVCDFLPADARQQQAPADIAELARTIHQLPPLHHRLDLKERLSRYEKQALQRAHPALQQIMQCQKNIRQRLADLETREGARVCCHNDLLAPNRLRSGGKLWALDWEYCAMGSPWFDLAVISCGENYSHEDNEAFAKAYLMRVPTTQELADFAAYRCVYRYLELLWYLCRDVSVNAADINNRRAALLLALGETGD